MTWLAVLEFLKANWKGLAIGLALGFLLSLLKPSASTAQVKVETGTAVAVTQTAQAHSGGEITIPGRPAMPCPETKICPEVQPVKIVYDCTSKVDSGVSVSATASASINSAQGIKYAYGAGAVFANYKDLSGAYGQVELGYGNWSIPLRIDTNKMTSIGITYRP